MRRFRPWAPLSLVLLMLNLAGCGFTLAPPGFVFEHRHRVCRGWYDCNYLRRPSFTLLSYDHLPPSSARVKLFRWGYGGSVEKPREIEFAEGPVVYQEESAPVGTHVPAPGGEEYLSVPSEAYPETPPPLAPPSEIDPSFGNGWNSPLDVPPADAEKTEVLESSCNCVHPAPVEIPPER